MKYNEITKAYLAGLIDGNSSIIATIVPIHSQLKFKVSTNLALYLHKKHVFFLNNINKLLIKEGIIKQKPPKIRIRHDMADITYSNLETVQALLKDLYPYFILKKPQVRIMLQIIDIICLIRSKTTCLEIKKANFLKVCILVDKLAQHNNSKNRKWSYQDVLREYSKIISPVETQSLSSDINEGRGG